MNAFAVSLGACIALAMSYGCDPYKLVLMGDARETGGSAWNLAGSGGQSAGVAGWGGVNDVGSAGVAGVPAHPCSVTECGSLATLVLDLYDEWMTAGWSIEICINDDCLRAPLTVPPGLEQSVISFSRDADPNGFSAAVTITRHGLRPRASTAISLVQNESRTRLSNGDRFAVQVVDSSGAIQGSVQKIAAYSVQRAECTNCLKANLYMAPQTGTRRKVTQVATTLTHACAIVDNQVYCWGNNWWGNLGDGTLNQSDVPVLVKDLPGSPIAVAVGSHHSCAVTSEGLFCWGESAKGLLQLPTKSGPESYTPNTGAVLLAALFGAACANVGGVVSCWGMLDYTPPTIIDPIALSGFYGHFCAVSAAGAAQCWRETLPPAARKPLPDAGEDQPDADEPESKAPPIVTATGGLTENVTAISAGRYQGCAIMNGEAYCWGLNTYGVLGDGTTVDRASPVKVIGLPGRVDQISTGLDSTCATVDGAIYCWGNNDYGQLGNGTTAESPIPFVVPGFGSGAQAVSVGYGYACAIVNDRLFCWGRDANSTLGLTSELDICFDILCSPLPREILFP